MENKQPALTHETQEKERPVEYTQLEATIHDLIIDNSELTPWPEHGDAGNVTAIRYLINPHAPGQGSVTGYNFLVRIPEDPEEPTHIAVYDGSEDTPTWQWDAGATAIDTREDQQELTPQRASAINQLVRNSNYYREHKGIIEKPRSNPISRWFRSR